MSSLGILNSEKFAFLRRRRAFESLTYSVSFRFDLTWAAKFYNYYRTFVGCGLFQCYVPPSPDIIVVLLNSLAPQESRRNRGKNNIHGHWRGSATSLRKPN